MTPTHRSVNSPATPTTRPTCPKTLAPRLLPDPTSTQPPPRLLQQAPRRHFWLPPGQRHACVPPLPPGTPRRDAGPCARRAPELQLRRDSGPEAALLGPSSPVPRAPTRAGDSRPLTVHGLLLEKRGHGLRGLRQPPPAAVTRKRPGPASSPSSASPPARGGTGTGTGTGRGSSTPPRPGTGPGMGTGMGMGMGMRWPRLGAGAVAELAPNWGGSGRPRSPLRQGPRLPRGATVRGKK